MRSKQGMNKRARINIQGIVQGVGFRPFVYRLAHAYELTGWVCNTSGSVEIEAEGDEATLSEFIASLRTQAPPRARIDSLEASFHPLAGYDEFVIHQSKSVENEYQLISPDIATCEDCRKEIFSPSDRRYNYPFTNCTNCGPRFTIIKDIPYDRPKTTMDEFVMCPECQSEYEDPLDRRFHAQPNACPVCGPRVWLVGKDGARIAADDPLAKACELLRAGKILALKGLGGFHLACDATNEDAVHSLRTRKHRPSKPLAVMIATMDKIRTHCAVSEEEEALLSSPVAPIVLLRWKKDESDISPLIAPQQHDLGVMLPYTPLHHLLLHKARIPLVMTSGNLSGEPLARDNEEALIKLAGIADYFLLHDRDIHVRCDDSVCVVDRGTRVIRRARGYAPDPIVLPFQAREILACGPELKNTVCLTRGEHAFISQHIGDMGSEEALSHLKNTISHYESLFRIAPKVIACDMHPEYAATKYGRALAAKTNLPCVAVQHHHAHIVSGMIDNELEGKVIGVAFDGTGYGTDGAIWGGEFLIADWASFERVGQLEYIPMPGGEAAIRRPYRMALAYLYTLFGDDIALAGLPLDEVDPIERRVIAQQIEKGINSPLTSSAGRLFDTVAALIGVREEIDYEGQAAIELEAVAAREDQDSKGYPFSIDKGAQTRVVRLESTISSILRDMRTGVPPATISLRFHRTMAAVIAEMCELIAQETSLERVVLSGGVLQNRLLTHLASAALESKGLEVFSHHRVPCNDGGVSLGQAVVAHFASNELPRRKHAVYQEAL